MTCKDIDRLRSKHSLTEEARSHISSCGRCRQMESVLAPFPVEPLDLELQSRIEAAILPGLKRVQPVASVIRVTFGLIALGLLVTAAAIWRLGLAGWNALSALEAFIMLGIIVLSFVLLANALSHWMVPGGKPSVPPLAVAVISLLLLIGSAVALFPYAWSDSFLKAGFKCWRAGVACAAASAPFFWITLHRGYVLSPAAYGATAGLLAGLVGVAVLELDCSYLDSLHFTAWHIGAALTAMLMGALLGLLARNRNHSARA